VPTALSAIFIDARGERVIVTYRHEQLEGVVPADPAGLVASADGMKSWGTVSFMAVDSEASLVGGRTNWSMPKTLAGFDGEIGHKQTVSGWSDGPVRWRVMSRGRAVTSGRPISRGRFADPMASTLLRLLHPL